MRHVVYGPVAAIIGFLVGVGAVMLVGIWTFVPAGVTPVSDEVRVPPFEGAQTLEYRVPGHCEADDELAVYRTILSDARYSGGKIVIDEMSTRGGDIVDEMLNAEQVKGTSAEAIRNFKRWNVEPESLQWIGQISPRIEFFTEANEDLVFGQNNLRNAWDTFYKLYPGSSGLVSLSRIGFNSDHTEALAYVANMCGGLCGGGEFVVLKKDRGRWAVDRTVRLWVS